MNLHTYKLHCLCDLFFKPTPNNLMLKKISFFLAIYLSCAVYFVSAEESLPTPIKVLLFTANNLDQSDKMVVERFSKTLSASLADTRLGIITSEMITESISSSKNRTNNDSPYKDLSRNNKITLARELDASAILSASLNSFTTSKAEIPKFNRTVITLKLSANYEFISTNNASSFAGNRLVIEKKIPLTSRMSLSFSESAVMTNLVEEIAELISQEILSSDLTDESISTKYSKHSEKSSPNPLVRKIPHKKLVSATIVAKLKQMILPEIIKSKEGAVSLSGKNIELLPGDAEVYINGILVGNCSEKNPLKVPEGICRLQIKRAGFKMTETLINAYDGMTLTFNIEPTEQEYQLWREQIRFLQEINTGDIFNENQKKLAEGMFEFLKNSQYTVPEININKSLLP
jgi:hypothetical protein